MSALVVEAPPVVVTWSKDRRTVTIRCPHCRGKHVHGAPNGTLGHRNAHCHGREPGLYYVLVDL